MPLFAFKAEKPTGELYEGKREAPDKYTLYQDIKREAGDTVLSVKEVKAGFAWKKLLSLNLFTHVPQRDLIMLARNLGSMLEAGLPMSRSLSVIERQTNRKSLKTIIQKLSAEISAGKSLSESLKMFPSVFSTLFISMTRAGEESGSLPKTLRSVSDQMMSSYLLKKKIRSAMIYPAIIVVVIIVISILMLIYVVPTLQATFADLKVDLPWNTQLLISASSFVTAHTVLTVGVLVGIAAALLVARRTKRGKRFIDAAVLRLPVIKGISQESNSAHTARTLSSLLQSGVEVVEALDITADVVQNVFFKETLVSAKERIKKGEPLSVIFAGYEKLYPVFIAEMVSIGEETGKLAEMLSNVADYYEEEVSEKTKDLSTIIEPALMIAVGAAVGFFAVSILAPIYSLSNAL